MHPVSLIYIITGGLQTRGLVLLVDAPATHIHSSGHRTRPPRLLRPISWPYNSAEESRP
jgi:hypothetical protein